MNNSRVLISVSHRDAFPFIVFSVFGLDVINVNMDVFSDQPFAQES